MSSSTSSLLDLDPIAYFAMGGFALFFGLFFVGFLASRIIALFVYVVMFVDFASTLRRLKGHDEKSLAFQKGVEAKNKELPFSCSNKDYAKVQIMGMCAAFFLILITLFRR